MVDVFAARYRGKIDSIGGFDARGFVLGPPIAQALKVGVGGPAMRPAVRG